MAARPVKVVISLDWLLTDEFRDIMRRASAAAKRWAKDAR